MILRDLPWGDGPYALFQRVARRYKDCFLFESAPGPERMVENSILGFDPLKILRADTVEGDPLARLRAELATHAGEERYLPFQGGLVGWFGYDWFSTIEARAIAARDPRFPEWCLGLFLDGIIFDHGKRQARYFSLEEDRSGALLRRVEGYDEQPHFEVEDLGEDMDQATYEAAVRSAQEDITAGEVFQVVISRSIRGKFRGELLQVYDRLRTVFPSPYMYYLSLGGFQVVGSSPEMLVRLRGSELTTYPIAGTRPLGQDEEETQRLASELLSDVKERAEHAMLVDLARNDLGRISTYSSVTVPEYASVQRFGYLQHLVSRVEGRLRPGLDALDALQAMFPAGTVSGAPKIRAMEIIDRLEDRPRGPYAGVVGYLSFTGDLDTAIAIRTLFAKDHRFRIQAGAGIVLDSDPTREWEETGHKLSLFTSIIAEVAMIDEEERLDLARTRDEMAGSRPPGEQEEGS